MKNTSRVLTWSLAVAALLLTTGCGYRWGFLIPADVHSIHVRMADNATFWKEAVKVDNLETEPDAPPAVVRPPFTMEVELTEILKTEVVRRTPLRLMDEPVADTVLETVIATVQPHVLLRDAKDDVLAERLSIRVKFTWRDRRTGRILAQGSVTRPTDFTVPRGESFTTAARRSFQFMAEQIVEQMQEGF